MSAELVDLGIVLARLLRRWRRYAAVALIAGAAMYGITFLMPTWYRSRTVLLPPEESESMIPGLSAFRFLTRMPSIAGTEYATTGDVYRAILLSRSVMQTVADRFGLAAVYHTRGDENTVKELRNHVKVTLGADGLLTIEVEDRDKGRAAGMANSFATELDRFNVERRNSEAKRTRIFLERRVAETDSASRRSEASLQAYQESHHVVAPIESQSASVAPLADLMARQTSIQVQLAVLRTYLRDDNERVLQLKTELDELNRRIGQAPQVVGELARLIRDVRLYQQTYTLLVAQLEDARLREAMDTPTITILDEAVPVSKRARPLRGIWALAAAVLAAGIAVVWDERRGASLHVTSGSRVA
jgi:tyrosine-protein kinase Etk/Wzc